MIDAVMFAEGYLFIAAIDGRRACIDQMLDVIVPTAQHIHETDKVRIGIGVRVFQRITDTACAARWTKYGPASVANSEAIASRSSTDTGWLVNCGCPEIRFRRFSFNETS